MAGINSKIAIMAHHIAATAVHSAMGQSVNYEQWVENIVKNSARRQYPREQFDEDTTGILNQKKPVDKLYADVLYVAIVEMGYFL